MIEIILGVSILFNAILIWYVIQLLKKFLNISEELEGLFISLEEYSEHVEIVYGLERFYGDSTLENLLRHSKSLSERARNFRATYDVNYEENEENEEKHMEEEDY
tara:strand:+ start:281 stop:595 length:315 start_codon:yes stop_codon:yes gene_type:complete